MEQMQLSEIIKAVGAKPHPDAEKIWIETIYTDSREKQPNGLFIALRGERLDGHDFISQALQNGAKWILAEKKADYGTDHVSYVTDTTEAFLQIAAQYRTHFDIKVAAVTGSVGKTTTKEMTACVLESRYKTLKTEGNQNNQFGMPRTLLRLSKDTEAAVIEMGMCGFNEIRPLSVSAQPDAAIITCIGVSHMEKLGSRENILKAKLEITDGLKPGGTLVLNGDNDLLSKVRDDRFHVVYFGIENEACEVRAVELQEDWRGSTFKIQYNEEKYPCFLPAAGRHNVLNALAAFAAGVNMGISPEQAAQALSGYIPTGMRQRAVQAGNVTVMEDCYNASPDSMRAAITTLGKFPCEGKKRLILADMLELGEISRQAHEQTGRWAAEGAADALYAFGEQARYYVQEAKNAGMQNAWHFETKEKLSEKLLEDLKDGDFVWVKGSRGMELEKVLQRIYEVWKKDETV